MQTNKYDINFIDWARIIGIYLVILGHMQYCGLNSNIKNFIYLFHMPLFFAISGLLHKNSFKKSINSLCGMVTLFVIFNLPYYVSHIWKNEPVFSITTITANIPTWFFLTLGIVKFICNNLTKNKAIIYVCVSFIGIEIIHVFNINVSSYWYIKSIMMALPFFILGYYTKNIVRKKVNIIYAIICFIILIIALRIYGRVDVFQGTFKYTYIDYFIVSSCGVFLVFEIAKRLPILKNKILWNISRGTAIIVGCHYAICYNLAAIFIQNTFLPFLYSFLIILILYPVIDFSIRKMPILIGKVKIF